MKEEYEVIVCGAGHAGCEAALSSARMGAKTLLLTGNLDTIAQMSCNPAIGGLAKGHIVREIDALGGEMAVNSDATGIQFRVLNASKGPAVQAPRAQCDKKAYQFRMKAMLEQQDCLDIFQAEGLEIIVKDSKCVGIKTSMGVDFYGKTLILTTGTFLKGLMHVGTAKTQGGRMGDFSANMLSKSLMEHGIELDRLKTGTPARIAGKSIDFSKCQVQYGDENPQLFAFYDTRTSEENTMFHVEQSLSFANFEGFGKNQLTCYETYTNDKTAEIINKNLKLSAMYGGHIEGVGPRYCPSIEDKIVRFSDKDSHRLFLEPEGRDTDEWYINGLSTSMPFDIQLQIIHSIAGLENAKVLRPAYAVEYDYAPPTQIKHTLESRVIENLFCAGQINGTSGYEEAAGQGLIAGVNAVAKVRNLKPLSLGRQESYIGVLIDDLVTKGTLEPYRMFTSRAEYRLLLNHSSAQLRMYEHAKEYNLLSTKHLENISKKIDDIKSTVAYFEKTQIAQKLRRSESPILPKSFMNKSEDFKAEVFYQSIYKGYLDRDLRQIAKMQNIENIAIPENINFEKIKGLRLEAGQKFNKFKPATMGKASRLSGVSPADINVLMVAVKAITKQQSTKEKEEI